MFKAFFESFIYFICFLTLTIDVTTDINFIPLDYSNNDLSKMFNHSIKNTITENNKIVGTTFAYIFLIK